MILCCLVTLTSASTTPSTHECIVYIETAMAKPGAEPIPHKLVCATDDGSRRSITLLGDANEFFSGRVLSGVYRLTIPTTLISVDDTIDLDDPASDYIEIEEKPESRATYTGTFKVLVVRVHGGTGAGHTYSAAQLATNVFTTTTGELSLKSIYLACSKNQLTFEAATGSGVTDGVLDLSTTESISTRSDCRDVGTAAGTSGVSGGTIDSYDFTVVVCPSTTDFYGAAGVAWLDGYVSWYLDHYGSSPTVLVHELGHNLNFAHSGKGTEESSSEEYGDQICHMGGKAYDSGIDYGNHCFNAPKSYQTGWYPSTSIEPATATFDGEITDVNSYYEGSVQTQKIPVKITGTNESPLYFMLHVTEGITSEYMSADDQTNRVNVVRQPDYDSSTGYGQQSWTVGFLASGETYSQANWAGTTNTLKIQVCSITTGTPDVARVIVYLEGVNTASCTTTTSAPTTTSVPSSAPSTSSNPSSIPSSNPSLSTNPSANPVAGASPAPSLSAEPSKNPVPGASAAPSLSISPSSAPSRTVTQSPVSVFNCRDSPLRFLPFPWKPDQFRSCNWVGKKASKLAIRCQKGNAFRHCPKTCDPTNCLYGCEDSPFHFILKRNSKRRSCNWVKKKANKLAKRCAMNGVRNTCRKTCGRCDVGQ